LGLAGGATGADPLHRYRYIIFRVIPTSTTKLAPVTKSPSGPSRKETRAATSSGVPTRPAVCWAWSASDNAGSRRADGPDDLTTRPRRAVVSRRGLVGFRNTPRNRSETGFTELRCRRGALSMHLCARNCGLKGLCTSLQLLEPSRPGRDHFCRIAKAFSFRASVT
jgi:hypothetical protein